MKLADFSRLFFLFSLFFFQSQAYHFHESCYVENVPRGIKCILGVDIGGTNSDFGVFQVKNEKPFLLFSLHIPTAMVADYAQVVADVVEYAGSCYGISIYSACMGTPGLPSEDRDYSVFGDAHHVVDGRAIKQAAGIKEVLIVNDFEIIGYGLDFLDDSHVACMHEGVERFKSPKLIIGAGTGLGVSYMVWSRALGHHIAVGSELGCSDFSPRSQLEQMFADFMRDSESIDATWNYILGNGGIKTMLKFLSDKTDCVLQNNIEEFDSRDIFEHYQKDALCTQAVDMYLHMYARFAKLAALSVLPFGGLYIAGGVAAKNVDIFKNGVFLQEFFHAYPSSWFYHFFRSIPVYLIDDYNISLYGAAQYLLYDMKQKNRAFYSAD